MASCFAGLFAKPSRQGSNVDLASPVLLGTEHSQLQQLVREAMREEVKLVRDVITKDLRRFEVRMSVAENQKPRRGGLNVEHLQAQLLKTEELRRRRSLEAGALRKVLDEVRTTFRPEDEDDGAGSSSRRSSKAPSLSEVRPEEVLEEVREERERWVAEREILEEQIRELEEQMERGEALPVYDPEKEYLKRSLKQLQMSIESRDRYGCWVCNMQKDEQDCSQDASDEEEEEDEDAMEKKKSRRSSDSSDDYNLGEEAQEALLHEQIAACAEELQKLQAEMLTRSPSGSRSGTPRTSISSAPGSRRSSPKASRESSPTSRKKDRKQSWPSIGARKDYVEVCAVPGATKSSRNRISTPFVQDDALIHPGTGAVGGAAAESIPDSRGAVKFSEAVSVDVRKVDPDVAIKRTRGRVATPFVQKDTLEVAESKVTRGIKFNREIDEEEATLDVEAENVPKALKLTRDRIATPFTTSDALAPSVHSASSDHPNETVKFNEDVDIEVRDVGDDQPPMRRCRDRQATGFITGNALMEMKRKVAVRDLQFSQEIDVTEREVVDSSKPLRRTRTRQATGYVTDEHSALLAEHKRNEASQPSPSVQISEDVSVETRSVAIGGELRRCRDRKPTGHVTSGALTEIAGASPPTQVEFAETHDKAVLKDLQFSRQIDVEEREVADSSKPLRRTRERQATGFVTQEASLEHVSQESGPTVQRGVVVSDNVSVESREVSGGGQMRRCRERQATGFVTETASLEHVRGASPSAPSVQISDNVSVDSREVSVGGQMRKCRERKATGFVTNDALTAHTKVTLPATHTKVTLPANWGRPAPAPAKDKVAARDLQFSEEVDIEEREITSTGGPLRRTRERQATGYATNEHGSLMENYHRSQQPASSSVQISDNVSVEARDVTTGSQMRRCRDRQATGFVTEAALTEHVSTISQVQASSKDLQFSHHVDVEERTVADSSKPLRRTRERQATGFVTNDALVEHVRGLESTSAPQTVRIDPARAESIEVSATGPLRSCRDRQVTGFLTDAALREHATRNETLSSVCPTSKEMEDKAAKELAFSERVDIEERAVADTGKPMRSIRSRQATGFVTEGALMDHVGSSSPIATSSVQISEDVSIETREVGASGQMRKCRNRQATGFVTEDALSERLTSPVVVQESAPRGLQFSQVVDVEEREVADNSRPLRRCRDRQSTGFVTEDALSPPSSPVEAKVVLPRGLQFSERVDVEEREVADSGKPLRRTRTRQATGFVTDDALQEHVRDKAVHIPTPSVQISDNVSVETREVGLGGQMRRCRDRQATGFAAEDTLTRRVDNFKPAPTEAEHKVQFSNAVSIEERQVDSSDAPLRRCRDRQATGFVAGDTLMQHTVVSDARNVTTQLNHEDKSVQFSSVVKVEDRPVAASSQMKRVRERVPTGYISSAVEVNFSDVVSIEERHVETSGKPMRSCRNRQATGFVNEDVLTQPTAVPTSPSATDRMVQFSQHVSVDEREAETSEVPMRSCRDRQTTGFVTDEALTAFASSSTPSAAIGGERAVQFTDLVSVDEREVANSDVPMRSCRDRQATGFVMNSALTEHDKVSFRPEVASGIDKTVQFSSAVNIEERQVDCNSMPMRSCRDRQSTGFVTGDVMENSATLPLPVSSVIGDRIVQFNTSVSVDERDVDTPEKPMRSCRDRQATGFVREDPLQQGVHFAGEGTGEARNVRFNNSQDVVAAASEAPLGAPKSVRGRVVTPACPQDDIFEAPLEAKNLRFSPQDDVRVAASEVPVGGVKSVRGRIATPYLPKEDIMKALPEEEQSVDKSIRFREQEDVCSAASETAPGVKSVRGRIATPYLPKEDVFKAQEENKGIRFDEKTTTVVDAAIDLPVGTKSVRDRIATPFLTKETVSEASPDENKGIRFLPDIIVDAASLGPDGDAKSIEDRIATPHLPKKAVFDVLGNRPSFVDTDVVVDAASHAPVGEPHQLRDRVATPHVWVSPQSVAVTSSVRFMNSSRLNVIVEAASESTGNEISVKDRVSTPRVVDSADPFDDAPKCHFADIIENVNSSYDYDEDLKSVRDRVATPHASSKDMFPDREGVKFFFDPNDVVESTNTESESQVIMKSVRDRIATPMAPKQDIFDEGGNVRFGVDVVENSEAKSSKMRDRVQTPFIKPQEVEGHVRYRCQDEIVNIEGRKLSGESRVKSASETCSTASGSERTVRSDGGDSIACDASGSEEDNAAEDSDATSHSRSTCSSNGKRRSRLVTPYMSKENIGINEAVALARAAAPDLARPTTPKGKRLSGSVPDSKEAHDLKEASFESHSEREISVRVNRALQRKAQQDRCQVPRQVGHRKLSALGMGTSHNTGNPEDDLETHRVPAAQKDADLLRMSLDKLDFFEDLDADSLELLVDAMNVYQFAGGEEVLRQGEKDGTHFFVVADGIFTVVKDGVAVADMTSGSCFGESVLLLFGERSATVRAKGSAKCYAMEGTEVREILRNHYKPMYESVTCSIDEIIKSRKVGWLNNLSAYQLQRIYDKGRVETFEDGATIFSKGQKDFKAAYVIVSGCINLVVDGVTVGRRERFGTVGDSGMLFHDASTSATAEGTTEVLTLTRELLFDMFGDQTHDVLMQDRILSVIEHNPILARLNEEQRELISTRCQMLTLAPGDMFDSTDVRFCVLLHGAVSTQVDGEEEKKLYSVRRDGSCCFGDEHLVSSTTWNIHVKSIDGIAKLGVWRTAELRDILLHDSMEMEDKMRVLQGIFLFRTLARPQLKRVASAMVVEHVQPGTPVFTQGVMGSEFYIIRRGLVSVTLDGRSIRTLGIGDYFGERALLSREPRSATITAVEDSELWKMGDETFVEIMQGPILQYLTNRIALQDTKISMEDLLFMRVIGRGGFGVVKMVCARRTHTRYALKCLRKRPVVENQRQQELQNERSILAEVDHPFIIKYVRSFRSETQVYLLTELVTGGELLDILDVLGLLKRPQAQFYCGSLILALEFLHARRIAYLDLKSENCLVDHQGYIKLIDFGIAQRITSGKCHNMKGTPMFMAPEMILAKGYTTAADLWSLGINLYEYMLGECPFAKNSTNHAEIFKAVLKAPLKFPQWFKQQEGAEDCMSLMRGLLNRDPARRAGVEGYDRLKKHAFFNEFSWDRLLSRQIDPPFIPQKETYGEGEVEPVDGDLRSLVVEEAECPASEEDDGWRDPDPGWDDDFA